MPLHYAISTIADGNMYDRHDPFSRTVVDTRRRYLREHGFDPDHAIRLIVTYDTDTFCRYTQVGAPERGKGMADGAFGHYDALITTSRNTPLFLPIADCIGVVLYDPVHEVLALAHFGRHSLEQSGGQRIIEYLNTHYGTHPADIQVVATPAAGKENYPIWALDNKGMKEVMYEQLTTAGVPIENITDNPADTTTDRRYYSYSEFMKGNRQEDGDFCVVAELV